MSDYMNAVTNDHVLMDGIPVNAAIECQLLTDQLKKIRIICKKIDSEPDAKGPIGTAMQNGKWSVTTKILHIIEEINN